MRIGDRLLLDPNATYDRKLSLLFCLWGAAMHVYAWVWILVIIVPLDWLLILFLRSSSFAQVTNAALRQSAGFGVVTGIVLVHLGGWAFGLFWTWVRAL